MKHTRLGAILMVGCTLGLACDRKTPAPPPAGPPPGNVPPPATQPAPAPVAAPASAPVPPAAKAGLPRSEEALSSMEVSEGSYAVLADGYRFQVKPEMAPEPMPGVGTAYKGTLSGNLAPADVTIYVTKEPFTGDLTALTKRQVDAARATGAKIDGMAVKIKIGGGFSDAYRFFAFGKDKLELQVLAVSDGKAFTFHAISPDAPNVYANIASDMMISGSTLHIGEYVAPNK